MADDIERFLDRQIAGLVAYGNGLAEAMNALDERCRRMLAEVGERPREGETWADAANRINALSQEELIDLMIQNGKLPAMSRERRQALAYLTDKN